jgi:hypothetical protein
MKQIKITRLIFSVLGLLLLFSIFQCYTTFKHPEIYSYADSTDVYHSQEISFIEDCSSCHEQNDPINDAHLQVYDYPLYQENYNWQYYYVIPWWVDEYYYEGQRQESGATLPPTQRRDFDRRGMPATPATPSPGVSGATLSKPAATSESSSQTTPQQNTQKRNERRQVVNKDGTKSQESTTTAPTRNKKETKETKKKKKQEKE